jgi:uncharacterized OsmC-like protein
MSTTAPRQWSVTTLSAPDGTLAVQRNGVSLVGSIFDNQVSPAELLLIGVSNCFALSCHAAMAARRRERVPFEVRVTGRKAAELPSRLATIDVQIDFLHSLPREEADSIAAHAKQLCTVSNTLAAAPACVVEVV